MLIISVIPNIRFFFYLLFRCRSDFKMLGFTAMVMNLTNIAYSDNQNKNRTENS